MSDKNRRVAFLTEMGLAPVWSQRRAADLLQADDEETPVIQPVTPAIVAIAEVRVAEPKSSAWADAEPAKIIAAAQALVKPAMPVNDVAHMEWDQLQSVVSTCRQCDLCKSRTQTVFGVGDPKAKWLFVGEGPGRNEDFQGEPFVGPAGKLLDNMFVAMGMKRGENTYIANVVKCRPTDANKRDRAPTGEEVNACLPYLERQIALIQPTVIVALGKTAALSLLKLDPATTLGKLRGTVHRYAGLPVIVTYHPAYLLRSPAEKSKAWADLCLAMQTYVSSTVV